MSKVKTIVFILLMVSTFSKASNNIFFNPNTMPPLIIDFSTKYTSSDEALMAAKNVLLSQKFIALYGVQQNTFTATRTTMSKADYYVADVTATKTEGKIKLTISFVKIGTGLLRLQKIADAVKTELEK